jgi:hypothetical protein
VYILVLRRPFDFHPAFVLFFRWFAFVFASPWPLSLQESTLLASSTTFHLCDTRSNLKNNKHHAFQHCYYAWCCCWPCCRSELYHFCCHVHFFMRCSGVSDTKQSAILSTDHNANNERSSNSVLDTCVSQQKAQLAHCQGNGMFFLQLFLNHATLIADRGFCF